jgi:hypothetical protein
LAFKKFQALALIPNEDFVGGLLLTLEEVIKIQSKNNTD